MTHALLLRTEYGWTDILGTEQTHFDSAEECEAAARELELQADEVRVVPIEDLVSYELIA
jgi:hypothetical protein